MKSLTRSSTAVQVERMEMGDRKVVSRTSRMLKPSTPMAKLMFQPATWIQGRLTDQLQGPVGCLQPNRVSIQMDRPKVARVVASAVQRSRSFLPDGRKSKTSTPTSGKKVTRIRGLVIKSIFTPVMSNVNGRTPDV